MEETPDTGRLRILESKYNLTILLFIYQKGTTSKMDLYNNISRNPRMPEKLKELEGLDLLTVDTFERTSRISLTDKGTKVAQKVMDIACEL